MTPPSLLIVMEQHTDAPDGLNSSYIVLLPPTISSRVKLLPGSKIRMSSVVAVTSMKSRTW
jgi:hypothetical protein